MTRTKENRAIILLIGVFLGILAITILTSCATTKRDCQGVKHYKLKNGIYL